MVHEDLDVREGHDECLSHVGDPGRIATVDADRAARDVVSSHACGIAAAPRLGVVRASCSICFGSCAVAPARP